MSTVSVQVSRIQETCDAFQHSTWEGVGPCITREEVQMCLHEGIFAEYVSESEMPDTKRFPTAREYHRARIAYLVKYGWTDPIEIDVGVPGMGSSS